MSIGGNVALFIANSDDEPAATPPRTQALPATIGEEAPETTTTPGRTAATEPGTTPPATEATGGAEAPPEDEAAPSEPPLCSTLDIPAQPTEAVTCRTASALLTIVDESKPLLLGDTHARVQSARWTSDGLVVRVRVRNETDAEQGIQAGGQELYVNLGGIRVDPQPIRDDERLPPQTGKTITLRFALTPGRVRVLERLGGRAELGVRPWTGGGTAPAVGVIRFSVDG